MNTVKQSQRFLNNSLSDIIAFDASNTGAGNIKTPITKFVSY